MACSCLVLEASMTNDLLGQRQREIGGLNICPGLWQSRYNVCFTANSSSQCLLTHNIFWGTLHCRAGVCILIT